MNDNSIIISIEEYNEIVSITNKGYGEQFDITFSQSWFEDYSDILNEKEN